MSITSKNFTENPQVVTVGKWDERRFDGLIVEGNYFSKGEARLSSYPLVRLAYKLARRAFRQNSYSLEDAPLEAYQDGKLHIWHHDLKGRDGVKLAEE